MERAMVQAEVRPRDTSLRLFHFDRRVLALRSRQGRSGTHGDSVGPALSAVGFSPLAVPLAHSFDAVVRWQGAHETSDAWCLARCDLASLQDSGGARYASFAVAK